MKPSLKKESNTSFYILYLLLQNLPGQQLSEINREIRKKIPCNVSDPPKYNSFSN